MHYSIFFSGIFTISGRSRIRFCGWSQKEDRCKLTDAIYELRKDNAIADGHINSLVHILQSLVILPKDQYPKLKEVTFLFSLHIMSSLITVAIHFRFNSTILEKVLQMFTPPVE